MNTYRPEQRAVVCRILTSAGWLTGTFHLPGRSRLVERLNRPTTFVRLTHVVLHGRDEILPFLALQRHEIILVLPPPTEKDLQYIPEVEPLQPHSITCLLEFGLLQGTVETIRGVRISDFFLNKQGFVLLTDCGIRMGSAGMKMGPEEKEARVIVNSARVLGVSDAPEAAFRDEEPTAPAASPAPPTS